ncbi:MAG: hypothetical protein CVT95_03235 [Bacteroidetes bacterium HGW-Bacteroidetes-12]|nr:MAG: hypothetical protein CVT95_03235 [Bacteroidetes bacterium HGW-Bacteroidetes-12]
MKNIFLITLTIVFFKLNAQEVSIDTSKNDTIKKEYYIDVSDQLLIKVFASTSFLRQGITNTISKNKIELAPLGIVNVGAAFNHKWLGVGATLGLPSNDLEIAKKGKTTRLDLMLNIYNKRFVIDGFYQNYKGYHLANAKNVAEWKSDTLPQFGNFRQEALTISGLYIVNHERFSVKSAFVKNAIQLKSAGSIVAGFFFNYDAARNSSGFLDNDSIKTELKMDFPFTAYSAATLGSSVGYSYNFVFSKYWYANATLSFGFGMNQFNADTLGYSDSTQTIISSGSKSKTLIGTQLLFRASFGYERNNMIIGINYIGNMRGVTVDNYQFNPF